MDFSLPSSFFNEASLREICRRVIRSEEEDLLTLG